MSHTQKKLFLAFEGIDGSGKSTQISLLKSYLMSLGHRVYATFEPTDSPIGKIIRDIFNHRLEGDQKVIAALFAADRLDHLLNSQYGILKKLEEGYTVITDRYYFSSYAYHSAQGVDLQWVIQANTLSANLLRPDLNIYLDMDPTVSLERIHKGRSHVEMYENYENLQRVKSQYELVFDLLKNDEKVFKTNGNRSEEAVFEDIKAAIKALI